MGYHTFNKKECTTAKCRLCKNGREETVHLVNECEATATISRRIFGAQGTEEDWQPEQVEKFMTVPKIKYILENKPVG